MSILSGIWDLVCEYTPKIIEALGQKAKELESKAPEIMRQKADGYANYLKEKTGCSFSTEEVLSLLRTPDAERNDALRRMVKAKKSM